MALAASLSKVVDFSLDELIFFVTSTCNMRCEHCFYWDNLNAMQDLPLDAIERIAATSPKFKNLLFSGGEPFLRKDLLDVIEVFRAKAGVRNFFIPTNGYWPDRITAFVKSFLAMTEGETLQINVSIDGSEEKHNGIRKVKRAFANAIETLDALAEISKSNPRFTVVVTTTVSRTNLDDVKVFADFLFEQHPPDYHNIVLVREGFEDGQSLSLTEGEARQIMALNDEVHRNYRHKWGLKQDLSLRGRMSAAMAEISLSTTLANFRGEDWKFPCVAGRVIAVIDANGDFRACELRKPIGNLAQFDYNLTDALHSVRMAEEVAGIQRDRCFCTHGCFIGPSLKRDKKTVFVDIPLTMLRHALSG